MVVLKLILLYIFVGFQTLYYVVRYGIDEANKILDAEAIERRMRDDERS